MTAGAMPAVSGLVPYIAGALVVGGVAVAVSRRRELIMRWCAWMVGVPVVVGAFYLGTLAVAVLGSVVGVVCAAEYARMTRPPWPDRLVLGVAVAGAAPLAWLVPAQAARLLAVAVLCAALVPVITGDARDGLWRASRGVLGVLWLAVPLAEVVRLGPVVLVLFVAVSVTDVAAYVGGRLLRGPYLSPLSPAKRWSGTAAGAVAGLATMGVLGAFTPSLAVAVVLGPPLGDLFESMVKRGSAIKDSGTWLAGSGGLLDRIDSLLLTLVLVAVI